MIKLIKKRISKLKMSDGRPQLTIDNIINSFPQLHVSFVGFVSCKKCKYCSLQASLGELFVRACFQERKILWFLETRHRGEEEKILTECSILTKPTNMVKNKSTMEGGDAVQLVNNICLE